MISDYIDGLYPSALDTGMRPQEFWDYSLSEINDLLESHNRIKERKFKETVKDECRLGRIIVDNIDSILDAYFLNENRKVVMPWDMFPELFEFEKKAYDVQREKEELEEYKEKRRRYAAELNARREGV